MVHFPLHLMASYLNYENVIRRSARYWFGKSMMPIIGAEDSTYSHISNGGIMRLMALTAALIATRVWAVSHSLKNPTTDTSYQLAFADYKSRHGEFRRRQPLRYPVA